MSFDPLEADYNEATLRAIDGDTRAVAHIEGKSKRSVRLAGVALAAAAVTGTRRVLDEESEDDEGLEILAEAPRRDPSQAVEVIFVPRDPHASVAIVRRWLLSSAP